MLTPRTSQRHSTITEKRKQKRNRIELKGVLFVPGRASEDRCQVVDFSPCGAGLKCSAFAPAGTKIVLYLDGFGRIDGTVKRRDRTHLAVEFHCSDAKQARIAEQLSTFVANGMTTPVPLRNTLRLTRIPDMQEIVTSEGTRLMCKVMDIALGGASLRTEIRPDVGETIYFGETQARVVRHTDVGIAIEFPRHVMASPQPEVTA
jgi:hypothetical protein